jgi:Protein of unknown function (DUF3300)
MNPHRSSRRVRVSSALTLLGLALGSVPLMAQQAWPPQNGYGSQYGQPYGYGQPQYNQPQYGQPGYSQPQYPQPQYGQPPYSQPGSYPQQAYPDTDQGYAPQASGQPQPAYTQNQALNPDQLEQLLAPVALYPDALLAQVLAASTYPAQIAAADSWLQGMQAQGYGSPDQIAAGADAQTGWDPSVKSLTAFPQVLDMMARNLQWTTGLGNAYYNQPQDVMQTVQVMRQRAEDAGSLQSTPQEALTYDQGYIQLAPPNPQVVYVPMYNPWAVYGQPVAPYPGFSLLGALGSGLGSFFAGGYGAGIGGGGIQYGLGIALAAFSHTPWGFLGWGLNWLANAVLFHQSDYFTHSTSVADWGLPHGGPRAYYGRAVSARLPDRYFGGVHRGTGSGYGLNPGQNFVRPAREFSGSRGDERYNPGYQQPRNGYVRPAMPRQQAYNRPEPQIGRTQPYASRPEPYRSQSDLYGRSVYGSGYANRPMQNYAARPGAAYGSPYQTYRAPSENYARGNEYSRGAYGGYGNSYPKEQRSGGFHLFGRGHESDNFGQARAPKSFSNSYRAPRSYGREKMPKMPRERAPKYHSSSHSSGRHR